jgi:hypothetical protein
MIDFSAMSLEQLLAIDTKSLSNEDLRASTKSSRSMR